MGPLAIAFGIVSAATIGFAALSLCERDAKKLASIVLFAGWLIANLSGHEHSFFWPVMDALFGAIFLTMWLECPSAWKAKLFATLVMQCACHVVYHAALAFGADIGYGYTAALNVLFLCQLLIVSSDGMKRSGNLLGDWFASLFDRSGLHGLRHGHGKE